MSLPEIASRTEWLAAPWYSAFGSDFDYDYDFHATLDGPHLRLPDEYDLR